MSAGVGAVSAPDFAVHDRRTNRLLGAVVRGLDVGQAEEREELAGVAFQVFGEAFVIGIGSAEAGQHAQLCRKFVRQFAQSSTSLFPFPKLVASGQCVLEQLDHGAWEDHGSASRDLQQVVRAAQHMSHALLMRRVRKAVIRSPAVVDQHARVLCAEHSGRDVEATRASDLAERRLFADQDMIPRIHSADPPTRFIWPHTR